MTRVLVSGICGRMGSLAAEAVAAAADLALVGGVESPAHACAGGSVRVPRGGDGIDVPVRGALGEFDAASYDVIVDFSTPAQSAACAGVACAAGKGLVVGTTGLSGPERAAVEAAAGTCAVVLAPNASVGANVLFGLVEALAAALPPGFDVEIVEAHHRAKRDAPSGTALRLGEIVCRGRGLEPGEALRFGRSGVAAARGEGEVGIHSLRGGSIVGRHSVRFVSELEELTVRHEAFTRLAFAGGAAAAARFVASRGPGLYDMLDVLGLRRLRGSS
ncbi:MAG: 4-hydroxy-tetrahydrodipicolinate reductase [Candidatus Eisenbacteria bacterium]|nr:4-hydroxy-tetrahydrodipicolinate reductase [Candidatus Eisenbacteria bacterium]